MRAILVASALALAAIVPASAGNLQDQALSLTAQLNENCSATLIWSDRDKESGEVTTVFLTAKHCVAGKDKADMVVDIPVYQKSRVVKKDRYIGRVRGQYYKADLALVELKDKQTFFASHAKIAPADGIPAMGEPVWTIGYPMGLQLTVTTGLFGSLETIDFPSTGIEYFRATPDVVGGNSGGSMYRRTSEGNFELIGVTTAANRNHSFMAFYTPIEPIRSYLKFALPEALGIDPEVTAGVSK